MCRCFIVPPAVLRELANDRNLDRNIRSVMQNTLSETKRLQTMREAARQSLQAARSSEREARKREAAREAAPGLPKVQIFDCQHRRSLPGRLLDPNSTADNAAKVVSATTTDVAQFYAEILKRNSIDNEGLDLVSSIHYLNNYDNAFWNGTQMVYGDGDGEVFIEFWKSPDVIGHELTHGVTQFESGLIYEGEPGALNESISDVFGAVFNQWVHRWPASEEKGWLVGAGILGDGSIQRGKTCLRNMLHPDSANCLSPQPASYRDFDPAGDVHLNSGIPNKAFATFAQSVGGNSWDSAVKVWYAASTSRRLSSNATFADFAKLTIEVAEGELKDMVQAGWQAVDLPFAIG